MNARLVIVSLANIAITFMFADIISFGLSRRDSRSLLFFPFRMSMLLLLILLFVFLECYLLRPAIIVILAILVVLRLCVRVVVLAP